LIELCVRWPRPVAVRPQAERCCCCCGRWQCGPGDQPRPRCESPLLPPHTHTHSSAQARTAIHPGGPLLALPQVRCTVTLRGRMRFPSRGTRLRDMAPVLASAKGSPPFPPGAATVDPNGSCEAKEQSARCCAWHQQVCDMMMLARSPPGEFTSSTFARQGGPLAGESDVVVVREPPKRAQMRTQVRP